MSLVLVVDDEPDVRLVARVVLISAGHQVIEAASGQAALDLLAADDVRPDVVLLDIRMPGMDGWEVLQQVRADDTPVPVVVFTAHLLARGDAPEPFRSYEHFLTKPFGPDDLLAAVERAVEAPAD